MRKHLIIYNIVFLIVANILNANIHHSHEEFENKHDDECIECLYNTSNSNYIFDSVAVDFLNKYYSILITHTIEFKKITINRIFRSRAPPIS